MKNILKFIILGILTLCAIPFLAIVLFALALFYFITKIWQYPYLSLIIFAIFLIPFSAIIHIGPEAVWYPQVLGLLTTLFILCSIILWQFNKYLSLFTLLCLFSTIFVVGINARALLMMIFLDSCSLVAYGISRFSKQHRQIVYYAICGLIFFQFIWMTFQAYNSDSFFASKTDAAKDEMVGLSGSADQIGAFFAITMPAALHLFWPIAVISIAGIIISKSSFAFFAGIISSLVYLFFWQRKMFKKAVVGVCLLSAVFFSRIDKLQTADFSSRIDPAKYIIKTIRDKEVKIIKNDAKLNVKCNPWMGYGFGNFRCIFPFIPYDSKYYFNCVDEKYVHAHNDFMETFVFELGYCGIVIGILLIENFVYGFIRSKKNRELVMSFCCVTAFLLNATGNFISQMAISGMLLIIFYGLYEGERRELSGKFPCVVD